MVEGTRHSRADRIENGPEHHPDNRGVCAGGGGLADANFGQIIFQHQNRLGEFYPPVPRCAGEPGARRGRPARSRESTTG